MMRIAALLALAACTSHQAASAHRAGEVMAAGGLIGLMATVAVAELDRDDHAAILQGGMVFIPVSVVGALMYAATDSIVNRPESPNVSEDRTADTAMALAKEAKHAARRGDCAEVLALEPRVKELDAGIYRRFRHDVVIKTCLPPDDAEPPELTKLPAQDVGH
jgi:hypothetical protein